MMLSELQLHPLQCGWDVKGAITLALETSRRAAQPQNAQSPSWMMDTDDGICCQGSQVKALKRTQGDVVLQN